MTKTTMIVDGCSPAGTQIRVYMHEFDDGRVQIRTLICHSGWWHCCNETDRLVPAVPLCQVAESYEIVRDIEEHGVGSL